MIPWTELDRAAVPGGGGELRLMQRGAEFSIMAGSTPLMNSRMSGSEVALADLVCARLGAAKKIRILIGGYGMGFTLRAALASLPADAKVTVAELVPEVLKWARGPMAELTAGGLSDPRVIIREGDVGRVMEEVRSEFDAILLDVDNGPDGLSRASNDWLYDRDGLGAARKALKRGGILAVWSASPNAEFVRRLGYVGFEVEELQVRAHKGKGRRHVIWLAKKANAG